MLWLSNLAHKYRLSLTMPYYKREVEAGQRVLDYGCGDGKVSKMIAQHIPCTVSGCDIFNYLRVPVDFKLIKDDSLDWPDKCFDVVMLNHVLHHTAKEQHIPILKEAIRLGKKLVILEDDPSWISLFIDKTMNGMNDKGIPLPLTHQHYTEWMKILDDLGHQYTYEIVSEWYFPYSYYCFVINGMQRDPR